MFLFKSTKLRNKLLTFAFAHPGESHYVRELAVHIDEDPGNLSRELKALEKEGLFIARRRGNLKLFALNESYPLYPELKQMIAKTSGIEGSLRAVCAGIPGIQKAFIYGSYAKNTEHAQSDIDLLIIGDITGDAVTEGIHTVEVQFNREINVSSYTEKEFEREKVKDGSFLQQVVRGKIIVLKGQIDA
jgi:predicted nucleotidyltransferase